VVIVGAGLAGLTVALHLAAERPVVVLAKRNLDEAATAWAQGGIVGVLGDDDPPVPLLAFRQAGLGRSVSFLGEADGEYSGGLATWEGYGDFASTLVRWISGSEAGGELFAELLRDGHEAVLTIEAAEGHERLLDGLDASLMAPDGEPARLQLVRTGPLRLEARVPLRLEGAYRAVVATAGGAVLRVPPVSLAYSPEYAPTLDPKAGERRRHRPDPAAGDPRTAAAAGRDRGAAARPAAARRRVGGRTPPPPRGAAGGRRGRSAARARGGRTRGWSEAGLAAGRCGAAGRPIGAGRGARTRQEPG